MGGKICSIYEGIVYRENIRVSPFEKSIEYPFNLKLKYEEEGNDLMVYLIKLTMNSLFALSIREDIDEDYIIRSETWLRKNNDDRVVDNEPLPSGEYAIKSMIDHSIDKIKEVEKIMPSHPSIFVLSHSRRSSITWKSEIGWLCWKRPRSRKKRLRRRRYFLWIIFVSKNETLLYDKQIWNTWRKNWLLNDFTIQKIYSTLINVLNWKMDNC